VSDTALTASPREGTGKGVGRKLRAAGRIPAVLYGRGKQTVSLALDPRALETLLHKSKQGMNTLIDLRVEGRSDLGETVVLVKEIQREPLRGKALHADLYRVDLTQTIEVSVPIHLVGTAQGVALNGGILDQALRELEIECLPRAIPNEIAVDVSALDIGDSLHVRDITMPAGVVLKSDPDLAVVSVVLPAAEEAPVVAAAEGEAAAGAEGAAAGAEGGAAKAEEKPEEGKRGGKKE
jgi:large subunit ribosomal protein L25